MEPTPQPRILPRCRDATPGPRRTAPLRLAPPFAIAASRCNRCGACLRLDCGAISDQGGESLVVDAGACSGCAACSGVCRARAIAPIEAGALARP